MCKLVIGIKNKKIEDEDEKLKFRDILLAQLEALKGEKDGAGAMVLTHDNKIGVIRDLEDYDKVFAYVSEYLDDARMIAVHTRTKTSGERDNANVHFFKHGDWLFAHNGWVQEYHGYGGYYAGYNAGKWEDDDSYSEDQLIRDLIKDCTDCDLE